MMDLTIYDLLGSIGAALIVMTYWFLQSGRLKSEQLTYSGLNALGAGLILISLYFEFNLSAFLIEFFWILISLSGIYKSLKARR